MDYFGGVLGALLSALFIIFVVLSLGYAIGAIKIKGVSLGSAGVLLAAIIVGVVFYLCGLRKSIYAILRIRKDLFYFWN